LTRPHSPKRANARQSGHVFARRFECPLPTADVRSLDASYFAGGRTSLNGVLNNDLQQNWRVGATLALPVNRKNSFKFYASSGVSARTSNNYDVIGVAWQYRWGGGL
jgi:hypothetical protein